MYHLDLFSGIGGFALACQWAGIETIGFVEIDKYCQKVLKKHWPNVPIVEDIRNVEEIKRIVANATQYRKSRSRSTWSGRTGFTDSDFNVGTGNRNMGAGKPTLLITAGFPCQPFSVAGKQRSKEDDRYLWPETLAVIEAVKPDWILLENVTGIINLALDTVLSDLEGAGYSTETLIIPACAVNAWHRRDRVWIVANSLNNGHSKEKRQVLSTSAGIKESDRPSNSATWEFDRAGNIGQSDGFTEILPLADTRCFGQAKRQKQTTGIEQCGEDVANSSINGLEGAKSICEIQQSASGIRCSGENWWSVEPELGRVAHGIPRRVDRLKCLGNAIVPQVAYELIKAIKDASEV